MPFRKRKEFSEATKAIQTDFHRNKPLGPTVMIILKLVKTSQVKKYYPCRDFNNNKKKIIENEIKCGNNNGFD